MRIKRPTKALIQNAIAAVQAEGLQAYALHFGADGAFRVELAPAAAETVVPVRSKGPKRFGEPK